MDKKSSLDHNTPILTSMVQATTPERIKELTELSRAEGAEAIGMQFCRLEREYRKKEIYRELFEFASPLPIYVTNYRGGANKHERSDKELAEELVELAECGATLCDVMGDYFHPCEGELTMDSCAIDKQMRLIDRLHESGAEVLMSCHVRKFISAECVLEIAHEHQRRGADICKIVTGADTEEEQIENLRIVTLLKKELKIPFLYLSGGECRILRRIGGTLGSCMTLCVYEYDELATKVQPLLRDAKIIRELM